MINLHARIEIPAQLPQAIHQQIRNLCEKAFNLKNVTTF